MVYYHKSGSRYTITNTKNLQISEILPVSTYTVGFDKFTGQFYLEEIESFKPLKKIYGDSLEVAERILTTFNSRPNTTGVLLSGEKGSGKTMLAKMTSIKAAERGIPTIVINNAWVGEEFNRWMQSIDTPVAVIFDEFEKTYDAEGQESILTLLDGTYPSKKLYIMTCNDRYALSKYMFNRPGRFFYSIEYTGLDEKFVSEYVDDNLHNISLKESILRYYRTFKTFNFDMLQALVEEMNRYEETVREALKYLNITPSSDTFAYTVSNISINGITIPSSCYEPDVSGGHLIALSNTVSVYVDMVKLKKYFDEKMVLMKSIGDHDFEDYTEEDPWASFYFTFDMIETFDGNSVSYHDKSQQVKLSIARKTYARSYDVREYLDI